MKKLLKCPYWGALLKALFVFFTPQLAFSQADSLRTELSLENTPERKNQICNHLVRHYFSKKQPDSAWVYIQKALFYAENAHSPYYKGMTKALEGFYYYGKKNRAQAISAYQESIRLLTQTDSLIGKCKVINNATSVAGSMNAREDAINFGEMILLHKDTLRKIAPKILYDAYNMLGANLSKSGDYYFSNKYLDNAILLNRSAKLNNTDALINRSANARWQGNIELGQSLLQEALDISTRNKNSRSAIQTMLSIASLLRESGHYEQAHEWYGRIWEELKNYPSGFTKDLSHYHIQLGNLYVDEHKYLQAEKHFKEGLQICHTAGDTLLKIHALLGLADLNKRQQKNEVSLGFYRSALALAEKARLRQQLVITLINSYKVFAETVNLEQAIQNLQQAIEIANSMHYEDQLPSAYKALSELYESNGQYADALEMQKKYTLVNDSIKTSSFHAQEKLSVRLATEEHNLKLAQQQILLLNREQSARKQFIWGLIATLAASILLAIVLYNRNRLLLIRQKALEERQAAQRKAEELQSFNFAVSHDLKSPLVNAERYIDLLSVHISVRSDQDLQNHLMQFRLLIGDMKRLIEAMTAYAQADHLELRFSHINTLSLIHRIVDLVRQADPERRINFEIGAIPSIYGDPLLLRQVFTNLLTNAVKFTRNNPEAEIKLSGARVDQSFVEIKVSDSGAGIPEEGMHRLFKLFKTAHDRRQYEGTGAGLAIVKRIVERHGGSVWVESAGIGKGATFTVRLPGEANAVVSENNQVEIA